MVKAPLYCKAALLTIMCLLVDKLRNETAAVEQKEKELVQQCLEQFCKQCVCVCV